MYHSITIGDKNTFDDWHLIAPTRPSIVAPQPKFKYIDVLGKSGSLDYTNALTDEILYSDREGSWGFVVLNPGDLPDYMYTEEMYRYNWADLYSEILTYLNGRVFDRIVLEDDPEYTYKGRVWLNEWRSNAQWSQIVLNYRLEPFKHHLKKSEARL